MEQKVIGKDTIELLRECNAGCKMAVESMSQIKSYINDERLLELITDFETEHKKYEAESAALLEKYGWEEKEPPKMASVMAGVMTDMKMLLDNSSSQIAKIMMRGCNMGIESLSGYLNDYMDADNKSKHLAERIIKSEETFLKGLKAFV